VCNAFALEFVRRENKVVVVVDEDKLPLKVAGAAAESLVSLPFPLPLFEALEAEATTHCFWLTTFTSIIMSCF